MTSDGATLDAMLDGGPDAFTGDPALARAPNTACYTTVDEAGVGALFPGYVWELYGGSLTNGSALTNLTANASACSGGLLKFQMGYDAPAAAKRPSFGFSKDGVPIGFSVDYVLESSTIPSETQDDVLVGPFAVANGGANGLLVLAVGRRAPSDELELVKVTASDTKSISLGVPQYPVHIHLQTQDLGGGLLRWTVSAQDRARQIVQSGTDAIPTSSWHLLMGVTRTAPGALNGVVFSNVKLPN
jgi:hypothetical protein